MRASDYYRRKSSKAASVVRLKYNRTSQIDLFDVFLTFVGSRWEFKGSTLQDNEKDISATK